MINYSIAVFIKLCDSFKTRFGFRTITKYYLITEQFSAVINFPIAVTVKSKKTIICSYPCCFFCKVVIVKIKIYSIFKRSKLYP